MNTGSNFKPFWLPETHFQAAFLLIKRKNCVKTLFSGCLNAQKML
ncbi:hypothetical protein [Alysiella filiformis]|nr:hypothetical protein [Alysiella filiformis]